jgi:hypothetical protein
MNSSASTPSPDSYWRSPAQSSSIGMSSSYRASSTLNRTPPMRPPIGLSNCYCNACVQCVFYMKPLRTDILDLTRPRSGTPGFADVYQLLQQ